MTTEPGDAPAAPGTPPSRRVLKLLTRLHLCLHWLTGGRRFNSIRGYEICFITMTGARSGRTMTLPLMYIPYRDGVLLVASQGGAPGNPAWYFNLVKYPDIKISHRASHMTLRARIATVDEKPDLWTLCDQHYAPYADYRARTSREIPIFVCE